MAYILLIKPYSYYSPKLRTLSEIFNNLSDILCNAVLVDLPYVDPAIPDSVFNLDVYPKHILDREAKKYQKDYIDQNRALGELDHPESSVVNLNNVSHNVLKMWWDGDDLCGAVQVLDTPAGKILKSLFGAGITLGISSRGLGSVKELYKESAVEVQEDFELICFDFVSNPSTHGAFLRPTKMNESVNKIKTNKYIKVNEIITSILCDDGKCRI